MTAADVQHRHERSHPLCSAASTNSPHIPLFTASLCRHLAPHTDAGSPDAAENSSLHSSKHLWGLWRNHCNCYVNLAALYPRWKVSGGEKSQ